MDYLGSVNQVLDLLNSTNSMDSKSADFLGSLVLKELAILVGVL